MDYGAGNGAFISYLKSKEIAALGYEPSESARENSPVNLNDITNYPHDKNQYSCITMWHVLEHIHNLNELLEQHHHHLSAEGVLVIAVPNIDSFDSKYYGSHWAALDTPRHLWHFTEKDIKSLLAKKGYKYVATKGMPLDSYYVSLLSEKYKKGFSLRAPIIGLFSNIKARLKQYPFSSQIYIFRKKQV
jgi:2-polyprenyl-3-methyl-5-hydroxy-6-metoxy-1,4-benzoquinol methylase